MNKTYNILVIGCQMNKSDSERIASYLEDLGYTYEEDYNKADIFILTTCGVRQTAEDRIYGLIPSVKRNNKKVKIILTGCLAGRADVIKRLKDRVDIWMPINELPELKYKLNVEKNDKAGSLNYLNINPKYDSKFTAFVPIGNGCNNFCSYCVVPYARGREVYRPHEEILTEVKSLISKGYKEITLIAQNVNSYKSEGVYFPELLKMIDKIEGDFWIRFSTSHPKDLSDDLIKVIKESNKVCHHLHMAVQSGDNEILKIMNRKYTVEHYIGLIKKVKESIPDICLTTDIIVGFSGETKKQFNNTKKLMKKISYDVVYISQYSPRYGTVSFEMDDNVSKEEKAVRERELTEIMYKTNLKNNKKYLKKTVRVLAEGKKKKDGLWFGKTSTFKVVKFENNKSIHNLVGQFVDIKIGKIDGTNLVGEMIAK